MRHLKKGRKFGRERDQRNALLRSLCSSFFMMGKIKTMEARAKEVRPLIERFLTRAKIPTLASRRLLRQTLGEKAVKKVFEAAAVLGERKGGYTRIIKLGRRMSDGAAMAMLEMVQ